VQQHGHGHYDRRAKQLRAARVVELTHFVADLHAQVKTIGDLRDGDAHLAGLGVVAEAFG
jgi:hypothetical protein